MFPVKYADETPPCPNRENAMYTRNCLVLIANVEAEVDFYTSAKRQTSKPLLHTVNENECAQA